MYRQQLAQLDAAENGLCFGRLEFNDGATSYIGRIGMHADNEDYDQLLMDWRADAARPFYLATAASPGEVQGPPAHQDQGQDRASGSTTRCWTSRPLTRPGTRG